MDHWKQLKKHSQIIRSGRDDGIFLFEDSLSWFLGKACKVVSLEKEICVFVFKGLFWASLTLDMFSKKVFSFTPSRKVAQSYPRHLRAGQLQQLQDAGKVCRTLLCLSHLLHAVQEIFLNLEWIPLLICKFYLVLLFFYSVLPKLFLNNLCVFTVNDTR